MQNFKDILLKMKTEWLKNKILHTWETFYIFILSYGYPAYRVDVCYEEATSYLT